MFASMFKSLFNKSDKKTIKENKNSEAEIIEIKKYREAVNNLLDNVNELDDELKEDSVYGGSPSTSTNNLVEDIEFLSISNNRLEYLNDDVSIDNFDDNFVYTDDTQNEVGSIEENKQELVKDSNTKNIINEINSLQCLFTWNIKSMRKKNVISLIQNRYGKYNLDISSPEFTFERYIGNLVISYEMFHNGETEEAQLKILEIGKWLEDLDSGPDEFYLSIKTGLKHVMTSTFIHMLFATNLIEECKWLLDEIVSFKSLDSKSKATVHAIHAAILMEYGGNFNYFKKANKCISKACELDPNTSYWFYIYSLILTAERHALHSYKSCPTEYELNAIQHAIMLSDGKNVFFNYHRMTLDRDTTIYNFHNNINKRDKSAMEKNLQENQKIVQMIKTIIGMKPKDPLIIIQCARTLMTLPSMVRDLKLGKQYLKDALEIAPNDSSVLHAIKKAIDIYNGMSLKNKHVATKTTQNQPLLKNKMLPYKEELELIVKKYKTGKDPIPSLTDLAAKYNGHIRNIIMAEICSYTILFTDNLRTSVEQFIMLIEQPGIANSSLITNHISSFSSKKFNLAELFCNEIRLATNSCDTSEDILFYLKMLAKIMETCHLNIKDLDSSMKVKLNMDSSAKSTCSNTTHTNETNLSDNESIDITHQTRNKGRKPKHLQKTGPKVFSQKSEFNKTAKKTNDYLRNAATKNNNASTNVQNKTHQAKASDELKFKMSKFLNSSVDKSNEKPSSSNNTNFSMENLKNLQTQAEIENYTKQLYQNILNNTQQQRITHNLRNSQDLNMFFNQNYANFSPLAFQQTQFQNIHPPPLLSLRPQISEQNPHPAKSSPKKDTQKKK